ncbi:Sec-independent protein translocase protein TatC [Flavimobilis marinus]|uniref:Sec-independent protein translocase protein TatC n=2 Tax=Flavimobilis marinus TaxID=285351 RepID=A0A1I2FD85_9MICO|nr:Sec-independent protein translocase protein TatC [Flavimobilis marinus]SFF02471.1 Sec-independent protein translocase TatC [Flavimobilis marinus]
MARGPRDGRMPLREHLVELRRRLVLAAVGVAAGAVVGWFIYQPIFEVLQEPLLDVAAERGTTVALNFAGAMTALDMQLKMSVFLGVLVSSPWWLYQLWAYITPGLTRRERLYSVGFVAAAVPLFLAGAAVAWWVLPRAVVLLVEFVPQGALNIQDAQGYLGFVMRIVLAFGIAFLLPVVMVALNLVGLVRARTYLRAWRWAVVAAFTFSAMMTPTADVLTMFALAMPICGLYAIAVGVGFLHDRRADRRAARLLAENEIPA